MGEGEFVGRLAAAVIQSVRTKIVKTGCLYHCMGKLIYFTKYEGCPRYFVTFGICIKMRGPTVKISISI